MYKEKLSFQINILNISIQNDKLFSRSNINIYNRVQIRNCCLFNKFVYKKCRINIIFVCQKTLKT